MDFSDSKTVYVGTTLSTDVLGGFLALIAVIAITIPLGGFSFFKPWLIVGPIVFFVTGIVRGKTAGNAWAKALAINVPPLLLLMATLRGTTLLDTVGTIVATFAVLVLCVGGGIWLRRRRGMVDVH